MRHLIGSAALLFSVACPPFAGLARAADAPSRGESPDLRVAVGDSDPATLFALGQRYMLGQGVTQDLATAEDLFAKAAGAGNAEAADAYGLLVYQRGDHARAMPYVEAAAARGDPRAQYFLGLSLFNGDAAAKDWVRGYALVSLASQQGLEQARAAQTQMHAFLSPQQLDEAAVLIRAIGAGEDLGPAPAPPRAAPPRPAPPRPAPPRPAMSVGSWKVQLGVFRQAGNATALWNRIKDRAELAGHARILLRGQTTTTLQAGGFADAAQAAAACRALIAAGFACMATR